MLIVVRRCAVRTVKPWRKRLIENFTVCVCALTMLDLKVGDNNSTFR